MKKLSLLSLVIFLAANLLTSCGGDAPKQTQQKENVETRGEKGDDDVVEEQEIFDDGFDDADLDDDAAVDVVEIQVETPGNTMADMRYSVEEIRVPAGAKVVLTLTNTAEDASMIHNIVFVAGDNAGEVAQLAVEAGKDAEYVPDHPAVVAASGVLNPGDSETIEFTAPDEAGEHEFICTYPGHYPAMGGKFIVE